MACWDFQDQRFWVGRSAEALSLCRQQQCCISRDASAPARAQWTFLKAQGGWEREVHSLPGLVSFLEHQPGVLQGTDFGCSWCRSPYHHISTVICRCVALCTALHCSSKSGIANVHHPLGSGAGCVPDTLSLQGDTGLLTMSRVFTQEQRDRVTSPWNPGSRGLCGLLCLKAAAQSSFQVRLLPFSPTWLLLKGENRGFLVPKQQQSWWPQSNAPPKTELAPIYLTCLAMIYPTAFFCNAVWVWSSAVLRVVPPQARQGWTLYIPPFTQSLTWQGNAQFLHGCTCPSAVNDVSSISTESILKYI